MVYLFDMHIGEKDDESLIEDTIMNPYFKKLKTTKMRWMQIISWRREKTTILLMGHVSWRGNPHQNLKKKFS